MSYAINITPSWDRFEVEGTAAGVVMFPVAGGPPRIRTDIDYDAVYPLATLQWDVDADDFELLMEAYRDHGDEVWEIPMVMPDGFDTYLCMIVPDSFGLDRNSGERYYVTARVEVQGAAP